MSGTTKQVPPLIPAAEQFEMLDTRTGVKVPVRSLDDKALGEFEMAMMENVMKARNAIINALAQFNTVADGLAMLRYERDRRSRGIVVPTSGETVSTAIKSLVRGP